MKRLFQLPLVITSLVLSASSFAGEAHMKAEFDLQEVHNEPHPDYNGPQRRNLPQGFPVTGPYGIDESHTWNKHSHEEHTSRERLRDKD